jgi:hypothetical protein
MKYTTTSLCMAFAAVCALTCCKPETKSDAANASDEQIDTTKKELWAGLVESNTSLVMPEGWDEEYWKSVNKNTNINKLFNTVVDAVLSGKKQAYDIFTDSVLTVQQVAEMVGKSGNTAEGASEKKVNADDLSLIRMREKWVFDKEKFKLEKQVTRIDLVYKKLDENGEIIGNKPLFYVNL